MSKIKPILNEIVEELKKPENAPENNRFNIFKHYAKISGVAGKIGSLIFKASTEDEPEQYSVLFNGMRNGVLHLIVVSINFYIYLNDNFDAKGGPVEK